MFLELVRKPVRFRIGWLSASTWLYTDRFELGMHSIVSSIVAPLVLSTNWQSTAVQTKTCLLTVVVVHTFQFRSLVITVLASVSGTLHLAVMTLCFDLIPETATWKTAHKVVIQVIIHTCFYASVPYMHHVASCLVDYLLILDQKLVLAANHALVHVLKNMVC